MNHVCASVIALQILLGGIHACLPNATTEIIKTGPLAIPGKLTEQVIEIVVEIPSKSLIDLLLCYGR